MLFRRALWISSVFSALFSVGCVTAPPKPTLPLPPPFVTVPVPSPAVPVRGPALVALEPKDFPDFEDDVDTDSLHAAILQSLAYYQTLPEDQVFALGTDTYTVLDMKVSMTELKELLESAPNRKEWLAGVASNFMVYQSIGADPERTVVFSSYYEPLIPARPARTEKYRFPLYGRPPDLVDVDLSRFDAAYPGAHISGRREGRSLLPYPTRADIDGRQVLAPAGLEIGCAMDPLDVLDLQIEGSGWLDLK